MLNKNLKLSTTTYKNVLHLQYLFLRSQAVLFLVPWLEVDAFQHEKGLGLVLPPPGLVHRPETTPTQLLHDPKVVKAGALHGRWTRSPW